jgi:hypothetical protein
MQNLEKREEVCFQGWHLISMQGEETAPKKQNLSTKERSSTELRFASFPRSIVRDPRSNLRI